jgi:hypothetical protein
VRDEPAERIGDEPYEGVLVQEAVGRGAHCDAVGGIIFTYWQNGTTRGIVFATSPATPRTVSFAQAVGRLNGYGGVGGSQRGLRRRSHRSTVSLPWTG